VFASANTGPLHIDVFSARADLAHQVAHALLPGITKTTLIRV
jgi:hypothetical protein